MTISSASHTSTSYKGKLKQECTSDREPFTEKGNDGASSLFMYMVKSIFLYGSYLSGDIAERFHPLCLKDSGVLYEDPYVQDASTSAGGLVVYDGASGSKQNKDIETSHNERKFVRTPYWKPRPIAGNRNARKRAGKAFIDSLLPRINPKSADGGHVMPFELEVVEAALHSRIQRFEDRLMELDPRVSMET
ncbi:hypothetical protein L2E82_39216 [Cichorium intybus]|uniref:Uncharacterized protein n=1 Tax=Cichorium intybus TaxID=13427 RepID=A0ACB9AGW2_CICIN|nr:hypothetical protein L2E82_39216 [Cichorium intybus]